MKTRFSPQSNALRHREHFLVDLPQGGDVRTVIAYPNRYWIAMSNLGFQTVYRLLHQQPRFLVERAFLPEKDDERVRTFETNSPLSSAEILAVSVSFETDYPYVVSLLAQAGLDLESCWESRKSGFLEPYLTSPISGQSLRNKDQHSYRPLIIGGGAALTLNPEPLANFFDAILIGEAEEVIGNIAEVYLRNRDRRASRTELLTELSQIEGVYVPSLYQVNYHSDHTISHFSQMGGAPVRVLRRYVEDLDKYPTHTVIQTPDTEFKSMFMTETGRGCEVGCRFCVAGYMYRPTRKRSAEAIQSTLQLGIEKSESIGFVGAAVSSHPHIAELARSVAQQGKRAALSSMMSQKVTQELASSLSESEYKTVALAPEAGSEKLRFRLGKRVCNEQVVDAVSTLASSGIRNFKLYFMVGLPSEMLEDVYEIIPFVLQIRDEALRRARTQQNFSVAPKIILSVNPFIPKAWTPFQRHGFLGLGELKKRLEIVLHGIRSFANVEMKWESPRESYFQTLMSRGDRRVGDYLIKMHQSRHDWKWLVKKGDEEILPGVPPPQFYVYRTIAPTELLPWEIVDLRIKRSLLEREYERTFSEDVTPLILRAKNSRKLATNKSQVDDCTYNNSISPGKSGKVSLGKVNHRGRRGTQRKKKSMFPPSVFLRDLCG